jgi:hypothetical protein
MTLLGFVGGTQWPVGAGGQFTKDPQDPLK